MESISGIIVKIVKPKDYGFILSESGESLYFKAVGVVRPSFDELREGMSVTFMAVDDGERKLKRAIGIITE